VRRPPGRLADLLRLGSAAGLLGVVALVTFNGVSLATRSAEKRRLNDRLDLVKAFSASLADALGNAQRTATDVAEGRADPAQLSGWDQLRVDGNGRFTGTSGRYQSLSGPASSHPCSVGAGLRELIDALGRASAPVAMVIDAPGSCDLVLAIAVRSHGGAAVITGDTAQLLGPLAPAAHLSRDVRTFVVDSAGTVLSPGQLPAAAPAYLRALLDSDAPGPARTVNYAVGDGRALGAYAPVVPGWSVVVEQSAGSFGLGSVVHASRPAVVVLGALFAAVLLLQALSDARRRRAAQRADAHRVAFLAVLSHELRTPLTVISGFVDTLAGRWSDLDETQRHELVDRLPQQSRRLTRVVERLLLAAKMQSGSLPPPDRATVAVGPCLERVVDDFAPMAPLHEFRVDVEPGLSARADARALDQILDQLVDNAVKYSPSGGAVRLGAVRHRGRIEVFVEDDGIGLPSDAGHIFDAFVQGESVEGRVHAEGGVGVGLYIVRALAEQLGGTVRAERPAHGGARFVVTLRAGRARVAAPV